LQELAALQQHQISLHRFIFAGFAEILPGQGRVKHAPQSGPKALDPPKFQQGK